MYRGETLAFKASDLHCYVERAGLKNVESSVKPLLEFKFRRQSNDNAFVLDQYALEGLSH